MFKGTVEFRASVESNPIVFDEVFLKCSDPAVDTITLQSRETSGISISVTLKAVATKEDGSCIAAEQADMVLDTLAFERHMAIARPRLIGQSFQPVEEPAGQHAISTGVTLFLKSDCRVVSHVDSATIENQISGSTPASAMHKRMFRKAVRSRGGVERFMHLYNLLMMLLGDDQARLDQFIRGQQPGVPDTPSPHKKKKNVKETIYTRLRNE